VLEALIQSLEFGYTPRELPVGPTGQACPLTTAFNMGRLSMIQEIKLAICQKEREADESRATQKERNT
jgi:hypothetical protein